MAMTAATLRIILSLLVSLMSVILAICSASCSAVISGCFPVPHTQSTTLRLNFTSSSSTNGKHKKNEDDAYCVNHNVVTSFVNRFSLASQEVQKTIINRLDLSQALALKHPRMSSYNPTYNIINQSGYIMMHGNNCLVLSNDLYKQNWQRAWLMICLVVLYIAD